MKRTNWRLSLAYDGTDYVGWQKQNNGVSVQALLEKAIDDLAGQKVEVMVAGRTDSGVHARGQVCNVSFKSRFDSQKLLLAFRAKLPKSISVFRAFEMPENFNARRHAIGKRYVYRIYSSLAHDPFSYKYAWHVKHELDIESMQRAATYLVGEHDYESFRSSQCVSSHARRYLWKLDVTKQENSANIEIEIRGNAFCHNMVRIISGTLVEVGRGKMKVESIPEILQARKRAFAGKTAPPNGLTLEEIYYPDSLENAEIPASAKFPRFPPNEETWPFGGLHV